MGVLVNPYWLLTGSNTAIGAQLGDEPAGLAIDFLALLALVRGHTTNFLGDPNSLLTYSSPSTKWITNGLGVLSSGTTLRCDHDPATLDSSTSSLTSLGVGTGIPIQMSVVTTGAVTYVASQVVRITDAADVTKWMVGTVVSWTAGTSTLVVNVYASTGYISGSSWKVIVALGVLIEEQQTNLLQSSEGYGASPWTNNTAGSTIVANDAIAPDGTMTADRYVESVNADGNGQGRRQTVSGLTASTTYRASFFAKAGGRNRCAAWSFSSGNTSSALFTLTGAGSVAGANNPRIVYVGNGWYRCSFDVVTVAAQTSRALHFGAQDAGNFKNYQGDGASGCYFWGFQLELGSVETSYIQTTSAQVTRARDNISLATSALPFSLTAGTLLTIGRRLGTNLSAMAVLDGNSGANRIINYAFNTGTSAQATMFTGGVAQYDLLNFGLQAAGTVVKMASAWAANDAAAIANGGGSLATDNTVSLPSVVTTLQLGDRPASGWSLNGHLRQVKYLPRRASNTEIQAMAA